MIKVEIPKDKKNLQEKIAGLRYLLTVDTSPKDKEIHSQALKELEEALRNMEQS